MTKKKYYALLREYASLIEQKNYNPDFLYEQERLYEVKELLYRQYLKHFTILTYTRMKNLDCGILHEVQLIDFKVEKINALHNKLTKDMPVAEDDYMETFVKDDYVSIFALRCLMAAVVALIAYVILGGST